MADAKEQANALKVKGNESLAKGNFWSAVENYSEAIKLDPGNSALYSNRSVANTRSGKFAEALEDAEKSIELNSTWSKGYMRKGHALQGMNRHEEAMMAFMEGLDIDPDNQAIKQGINECKANLTGPSGSQPLVNPFADAQLWEKIRNDPMTREYMADPEYKEKITQLNKDPTKLAQHMQDSRIMNTLGVLLGVGLTVADAGDNIMTEGAATNTLDALAQAKEQAKRQMNQMSGNNTTSGDAAQNGEEGMEVDATDNQNKALAEKELGNAAYKKKDFPTALEHYGKAIELDSTNITFRTNKAAVYFEQGEYDTCIKICEEAVDVGRENRADYKLIAKAFARIGSAYHKMEDYDNALKFYNKSLSEHRDRTIATKVQEIGKLMAEKARLAAIDPEKAAEEKNKGNEFFKKADYPSAIRHYTQSILRNPEDAKVYSNRAACYTKLAEFNMALKDADDCIKLDPKFKLETTRIISGGDSSVRGDGGGRGCEVRADSTYTIPEHMACKNCWHSKVKGYLRRGNILLALKESQKSADAFQKALDLDSTCQEAIDGYRKAIMLDSSNPDDVRKRAMQNPEVQQILADPAMQLILQQMQKDPKALQEHLKDPHIAKKIEKLLECGLIAIR